MHCPQTCADEHPESIEYSRRTPWINWIQRSLDTTLSLQRLISKSARWWLNTHLPSANPATILVFQYLFFTSILSLLFFLFLIFCSLFILWYHYLSIFFYIYMVFCLILNLFTRLLFQCLTIFMFYLLCLFYLFSFIFSISSTTLSKVFICLFFVFICVPFYAFVFYFCFYLLVHLRFYCVTCLLFSSFFIDVFLWVHPFTRNSARASKPLPKEPPKWPQQTSES